MLISITFGQIDDANLHMTCCAPSGQEEGAVIIWKYADRLCVGVRTGWHRCILPRVMAETHDC